MEQYINKYNKIGLTNHPISDALGELPWRATRTKAVLVLNQHGCAVPSLKIRETER
jgi:hypothetical protein